MNFACTEAEAHGFDHRPVLVEVQNMLFSVLSTLDRKGGEKSFQQAVEHFSVAQTSYLVQLHHHGVTMLLDPEHAMTEIVKKWCRIHDIGRLSIILPAYTLMDSLCICLSGVLLDAKVSAPNFLHSTVSFHALPPSNPHALLHSRLFQYDKGSFFFDSSYWAIGVFGYLAFYLNCLVRSLDDPFDSPEDYQFHCYAYMAEKNFSAYETWKYGTCIDFACLTVHWGSNLRKALNSTPQTLSIRAVALSNRFITSAAAHSGEAQWQDWSHLNPSPKSKRLDSGAH